MEKHQIAAFPALEGPFLHHVYIGFCQSDVERVKSDVEKLLRLEPDLKICTRNDLETVKSDRFVSSVPESDDVVLAKIANGTCNSQKCLLYVSCDYLQDPWHSIEVRAVLAKASCFRRLQAGQDVNAVKDVSLTVFGFPPEFVPAELRDFMNHRPNDEVEWKAFAIDIAKGI